MTKHRIHIATAFLVGILYRLLMSLQGIDSVDMGFCMTFYQNIFTHPDTMTFYFNYYLTGLIGGLWQLAFGRFGLLGFRVLELFTLTTAVWLLYRACRPWLPQSTVTAGAILLSFLFPSLIVTFHYDTLSFLLMAASVWALSRWWQQGSLPWLALAGAFIGISFFVRIVNGALFALILFPFFWGWRTSLRRAFINAYTYASGLLMGCLLVILLMALLGHLGYFGQALAEAFGTFSGEETSHTSGNLFGVYLKSYVNIGLQILVLCMLALYFGDAGHLSDKLKKIVRTVLIIALFVLVLTSQPYLSAAAICTLMIVITPHPVHITFYALVCAYLFPFGSDIGIPGIFHWCGGLLLIPAATCYPRLTSQWQRKVAVLLALTIAVNMVYKLGAHAYGEEQPRTETRYMAIPGTLNTLTDSARAQRYRHEVAVITAHADSSRLLLIGNQAAELYYATASIPFTGNTQMGTFRGQSLIGRLNRQTDYYDRLPLVAYILRGHDSDDMLDFRRDLRPWLLRHGYQQIYRDSTLQLFRPVQNRKIVK